MTDLEFWQKQSEDWETIAKVYKKLYKDVSERLDIVLATLNKDVDEVLNS